MKLVGIQITTYRSIEDSDSVDLDDKVTCWVGKNEPGKTAGLQAIYKLNPHEKSKKFDEVIDFPSRLTRLRKENSDGVIPVIRARFRLTDEELSKLEAALGKGILPEREFVVTAGYRSTAKTYSIEPNESVAVQHLTKTLDLAEEAGKEVRNSKTVAQLDAALSSLAEPTAAATALVEKIHGWRNNRLSLHIIDAYLQPWLPVFVYFDDYDTMPGKVSIPDLIRRRDAEELTRGEQALLGLLNIVNVELEDFRDADNHEHLIRELENASNSISDEVFAYWTQNKNLSVDLKILQPETGASAPLNEGPILQVRVNNARHRATVPFDERSRGFVWFFSFLAYFSDIEESSNKDLILLLDEPGLSLHGRAQYDLLRFIDERLATRHQVIYTTHSPFMVEPDHLDRVRTVIDTEPGGTKISAEIFKADEETAFPLLTAMGIEMTQTLFIAPNTLLEEGPSDLIYLDILSAACEGSGRIGLDERWVQLPIGGAGKLSTFATLLGGNKLNVAVLVDSSTEDTGAVKRLRENGQLEKNALIEIAEFTGSKNADIEDLFESPFYLKLVNAAYKAELTGRKITMKDMTSKNPRITQRIQQFFDDNDLGKFNHYRPAAALLRDPKLAESISGATLDKAEALFKRINALLKP